MSRKGYSARHSLAGSALRPLSARILCGFRGGLSRLHSGARPADMHWVSNAGTQRQNWPQFYRVIAPCLPEKNLASCIEASCAVQPC